MPFAPINGTRIYFETHGTGLPVIFAHGAGGNHLSWWQQIPAFARSYQCVTFDHRGWGLSDDDKDLGPAAFTDDLEALMDHLELEQAVLVGQSMGGFTCLGLAVSHPDRVKALVMANSFAGMRRAVWLNSPDEVRSGAQIIWEKRRRTGIRRALSPSFSSENKALGFLYRQIRGLNEAGSGKQAVDDRILRLRALERSVDAPTDDQLRSLHPPALFIGGEFDEVMPPELMKVAASLIPRAECVILSGVAHSAYFEAANVFNEIVGDFIQRNLTVI
jgi:3-oxoadipate enol-lactonase